MINLINLSFYQMINFSFIHSYVNYDNIAWASTSQAKLKKILTKQKHGVLIIFLEEKEAYVRPLLKEVLALNRLISYKSLVKNATIPRVLWNTFEEIEHMHPTLF